MSPRPALHGLVGTAPLMRFAIRRDRVRLLVWVAALAGVIIASAAALPPVYPDQASIEQYTALIGDNPALIAFAGPGYGFDDPNIGVILVNETQVYGMIGFALMAIFLVNRHTRAEEDLQRAELIRSSVVGRHAPTVAAIGVVSAAVVLVGALCLVGFALTGYPLVGSVVLSGSFVAVGLAFVGVAAIAAQVASTGRGTLGIACAALVVAFVLRALGDIGENGLRWLSPLGWAQSARAFAGDRWWPLLACLAAAVLLVGVALLLFSRRDLGSGMIAQRAGPARASGVLTWPGGLAVRLHRGTVIGWVVGMLILGLVYGSIGEDVEEMIEDNPTFADILASLGGASITDSFFATALLMLALIASGFAISAVFRLRTEEETGRAEPILAAPVGRVRWAASHLVVAVVGTALVIVAGGLGTGIAFAAVSGDASQVLRMTGASLVTVPPALVLLGVTMALFGLAPRAAMAAWGVLGAVVVVGVLGELLRLPDWTRQLSPFEHAPALPAEDLRALPLVVLLGSAAALTAAGLAGLRRRDLRSG